MLCDKPDLDEEKIVSCLRMQYGLEVISVRFLPIGHDMNAFVYEAAAAGGNSYFVKLRLGAISPASLLVPRTLIEHGIPNILAPLRTRTLELWSLLERYSVIVYPFIRGENAKIVGLSDSQWREFGATLNAIHSGGFGSLLQGQVPAETFAIPSAQLVRSLAARLPHTRFDSPVATQLAQFWAENAAFIQHILTRAEALGKKLQSRQFEHVLCHSDIHAANILVSEEGKIYLIDWDGPLLAPRERDLLFVVGAIIARRVTLREEALFFEGYGSVEIDRTALAYYRYERAIEDIGTMGENVFFNSGQSEASKAVEAALFRSQFDPGQILETAQEADRNQN